VAAAVAPTPATSLETPEEGLAVDGGLAADGGAADLGAAGLGAGGLGAAGLGAAGLGAEIFGAGSALTPLPPFCFLVIFLDLFTILLLTQNL
jgi:hypothetical protein